MGIKNDLQKKKSKLYVKKTPYKSNTYKKYNKNTNVKCNFYYIEK